MEPEKMGMAPAPEGFESIDPDRLVSKKGQDRGRIEDVDFAKEAADETQIEMDTTLRPYPETPEQAQQRIENSAAVGASEAVRKRAEGLVGPHASEETKASVGEEAVASLKNEIEKQKQAAVEKDEEEAQKIIEKLKGKRS